MPSPSEQLRALIGRLVSRSRRIYRAAIAEQIAGGTADALWNAWREPVSGLILASEAIGQRRIVVGGKMSAEQIRGSVLGVMDHDLNEEQFREVADLFASRIPVTRDEWRRMALAAQARADGMARHEAVAAVVDMGHQSQRFAEMADRGTFFAAGLDAEEAAKLQQVLAGVIRGETKVVDGRKQLRSLGLGEFIKGGDLALGKSLTDARYDNIMRTNMASAQTQSERRTLKNPVVRRFVPLLRWSAVHDDRTRETHLAMDGYVNTVEEYERQRLGPPAGYQCRCVSIPVPVSTAIENGWVDPGGLVNPAALLAHNGGRQELIDRGLFPDQNFIG